MLGTGDTRSDSELITGMVDGDGRALNTLHDRYSPRVLRMASRVLRNRADAEEVLQDVFMQAWTQAGRFSQLRGGVGSWLGMMARTRAIDRLRQGRRTAECAMDDPGEVEADPPSRGDSRHAAVRRAVDALPCAQRVATELWAYQGLTHAQIADVLGQPLGTIKTRLRLALAKLRDLNGVPARPSGGRQGPFTVSATEYFVDRFQRPGRGELAGVKVLLVADDIDVLEPLRAVLESAGARVTDGRSADRRGTGTDAADMVLTDQLRVIGVGLGGGATALPRGADAAIAARICKPVHPRALVDTLHRLTRGDRDGPPGAIDTLLAAAV